MKWQKISAFLLCIVLLLSLAACGGEVETSSTGRSSESESDPPVESQTSAGNLTSEEATASVESETATESETVTVTETKSETETVTETESEAKELTYEATGYESLSADGSKYSFTDGLCFTFPEGHFFEPFNRLTLTYTSDAPLHIYFEYADESGESVKDDFFLESGENMTFSGLILGYLEGKQGKDLTKLTVDTCEDRSASFSLLNLTTETVEVLCLGNDDKTVYIENEEYRLGIDLLWGGAISYLADLDCPIDGMENLVNRHDTGRLVQQSYYGTKTVEGLYESGYYTEQKWPYNPVQGGDRFDNASRLVDVEVTADSIYIKVQPQDWALDCEITPSYMENTYILQADSVRVDNRFVDFSGLPHPKTSQEIPAVYAVSWFDGYVWYDGINSWSNGSLTYTYHDSKHRFKQSNSETWCAFVNRESGYSFGVYVPRCDMFQTRLFLERGSKDAEHNSCTYISPVNTIQLVPYQPLCYSYLLAAGSVEEVRAVFSEKRDFAENDQLHRDYISMRLPDHSIDMADVDLTGPKNIPLFKTSKNAEAVFDDGEGAAKLTVTAPDPGFYFDYDATANEYLAEDYSVIEIEYMVPLTNSRERYNWELFLCTGELTEAMGGKSVGGALICDGEYHTLTAEVAGKPFWNGKINTMRFDFFGVADIGDCIYIRSVKMIADESGTVYPHRILYTEGENLSFLSNPKNTVVTYDAEMGATLLTATVGHDPHVTLNYGTLETPVDTAKYSKIKVTYRIPETNAREKYTAEFFVCAGEVKQPSGDMVHKEALVADGEIHTVTADLSQYEYWTGALNAIRFDYFGACDDGDSIYIYSIVFE